MADDTCSLNESFESSTTASCLVLDVFASARDSDDYLNVPRIITPNQSFQSLHDDFWLVCTNGRSQKKGDFLDSPESPSFSPCSSPCKNDTFELPGKGHISSAIDVAPAERPSTAPSSNMTLEIPCERYNRSSDGPDSPSTKSPILQISEAQITGSNKRRKRPQYLVLTQSHLIKFGSQQKLAEMFPMLAQRLGLPSKYNPGRSPSTASSFSDRKRLSFTGEVKAQVPLANIVAVHKVESLPSSLEFCFLNTAKEPRSFQAQFCESQERDTWLNKLRSASKPPLDIGKSSLDYIEQIVRRELDFDPDAFNCFRVVKRLQTKVGGKALTDGEGPLPVIYYLVIGAHKIHLIPLEDDSVENAAHESVSFGIMALTTMHRSPDDDTFDLNYRLPFRQEVTLQLSSLSSSTIMNSIYRRAKYLRPCWLRQPFQTHADLTVKNEGLASHDDLPEDKAFVRTLVAYCAAYDVNTSNICYAISYDTEDSPRFQLHPPATSTAYSARELLAIMRALRYNELFVTLSFAGVSLNSLDGLYDILGDDKDASTTRGGESLEIPAQPKLSMLSKEIRALALQSSTLNRVDFAGSISRGPGQRRDKSCGIPQAIFPLCKRGYTNIDWVTLTGIKLGTADLDYIVDAASSESSRIRALEVGYCGLSSYNIDLITSTIHAQEDTLEVLDLSGPLDQFSSGSSHSALANLKYIRKLVMSNITYDQEKLFFLSRDTLCNWRLEELVLSDTRLNRNFVNILRDYLASPASHTLRELRLVRCGLTEEDLASFMPYMMGHSGRTRELHIDVTGNPIQFDQSGLADAIRQSKAPTHLTIQSVAFAKEENVRTLFEAIRHNKSIQYLDISGSSLPHDVGLETTRALRRMFAENTSLKFLDISGGSNQLDSACFGIGLNDALTGLKTNHTLEILKIERQKLGKQGAHSLVSILQENRHLKEIHCEDNDFGVDSIRVLANGLAANRSLLYLPSMFKDRECCIRKIQSGSYFQEPVDLLGPRSSPTDSAAPQMALVRALTKAAGSAASGLGKSPTKASSPKCITPQSSNTTLSRSSNATSTHPSKGSDPITAFEEEWDGEIYRLNLYLRHNYELAHGLISGAQSDQDITLIRTPKQFGQKQQCFTFMKPINIATDSDGDDGHSSQVTLSEFIMELESHTPAVPSKPPVKTQDVATGETEPPAQQCRWKSLSRGLKAHWYQRHRSASDNDSTNNNTNSNRTRSHSAPGRRRTLRKFSSRRTLANFRQS